jgi:hypothetical protein
VRPEHAPRPARPVLAAAVIYALLCLIFVGQGLLPGRTLSSSDFLWSMAPWSSSRPADVGPYGANFEPADAVVVFQPFFEYAKAAFPDVPLWNPHIMAGRPFLANAQSALFSPFTVPVYVLPLAKAYAVMAMLKLFVAAFGTFLFGRLLGMGFGGALLSGIVFAFGTFFVVWIAWPLTNIFPLIGWLLLLTELLVRRPGLLPGAGLAALVGLQFFGGHPETSFHVMFAVTAYFVFRVLLRARREGGGPRVLLRPALAFGLAVGAGTALAAVTLLPLFELFVHSGDYSRRQSAEPSHADPRFIGALFLSDYWGRPTQTPLVAFVSNRGYYAGGITLMLAAVALVLRPTAIRLAFAGFAAFALAVVLGVRPIFTALVKLPGFETAHNGRMVVFVLFALAVLAGWGLDELTRRASAGLPRRRLALAAAAAIFCVPLVWMLVAGTLRPGRLGPALDLAWGFADAGPADPQRGPGEATVDTIRLSALLQWLPLAGAGLLLIATRLLPLGPRLGRLLPVGAFVGLAVAVLVADLFRANMGFNPAIPIEHAEQPRTGAIRYLQERRPNRFAGLDSEDGQQPLAADLANRYGLYDARGYDYPVERRYDTWWRATAAPSNELRPPTSVARSAPEAVRGMSLLSVADLIQDPTDPPSRLPGLELAYSGPDARVYRNTNALPRTFLVGGQKTVRGAEQALAATLDPGFDARRLAITERAVPGIPRDGRAPAGSAGTARLVRTDSERVVASATASRRSLLVLTDVHYPGWKARVDGKPAPIERVDYLLRGVAVPPGRHEVEFRYEPLSWRIGWIVSAISLAALAAVAAVGVRRRRVQGRPS